VDFDPAATHGSDTDVLTAHGGHDIYVAKYRPDNSLIWAVRMGSDTDIPNSFTSDMGTAITVDGSGNVYAVGRFFGTADFGPIMLTSVGRVDCFVAKLNSNGAVQWANRWGSAYSEFGHGVDVDAAGNVFALGARQYVTPDETIPFEDDRHGLDILKFSSTGALVWTDFVATRWLPSSAGMAIDSSGNVAVTGTSKGSVDFDPGPKSNLVYAPSSSAFVLKLTAVGKFDWVTPFAGQWSGSSYGYSAGQDVAIDGSGNVVVGGYYGGAVDFDPGHGTTTLPTIGGAYIAKLSSRGNLTWVRAFENASTQFVYGLVVDAAGSIYACGSFSGTCDFDPSAAIQSRTSAGNSDAYVVKLTANGNYSWVATFGGSDSDIAWAVAVDPAGIVHVVGEFRGTADFDPSPDAFELNSPAFSDSFLVLLHQ
jgi:hypothetical protein